ncbi:response regulator transcription factor [Kribbella speibonae]|uniref:Response regulator transcription factor n=1 Tax=Kribbella speibonae TaxID=1572660 RepID=A0ABY1ZVH5_9ACTN|nr:response regulator transcription factor [Kribbella speibonae]
MNAPKVASLPAFPLLSVTDDSDADVVVLDTALPDDDGLRIARELRDRYPGLGIVLLTSDGEDDILFRALEIGVSARPGHVRRRDRYGDVCQSVDRQDLRRAAVREAGRVQSGSGDHGRPPTGADPAGPPDICLNSTGQPVLDGRLRNLVTECLGRLD